MPMPLVLTDTARTKKRPVLRRHGDRCKNRAVLVAYANQRSTLADTFLETRKPQPLRPVTRKCYIDTLGIWSRIKEETRTFVDLIYVFYLRFFMSKANGVPSVTVKRAQRTRQSCCFRMGPRR